MNVVVFASDAKGLSSLNSIIEELNKQGHHLFAMVTQETQLRHPIHQKTDYQILCNVPRINKWFSNTLQEQIPFEADWLIINRERWNPENIIIEEFRSRGTKIALVEPNAWLLNGAESRLETYSRNRWADKIDIFFMGSKHGIDQQKAAGFIGNMVSVGNPKYDLNIKVPSKHLEHLKEGYGVSNDKENILLFSLVNGHRNNLNKIFIKYVEDQNKRFFYKPYPGEPFDSKYAKDYIPNFFLPSTTPILDEKHIWGMFELCDTHIGVISSIVHATLLKGKKYIDCSLELNLPEKVLDFSGVFQEDGSGLENNKSMWMNSFGFNHISQLKELLPDSYKDHIKEINQRVWDNLDNPKVLLTLFDDYNDGNAAKRIVDELQK